MPSFRHLLCLLLFLGVVASLRGQGTQFTYQGRLTEAGNPAVGTYDFVFRLYTQETDGFQIGPSVTNAGVAVPNGLFTVSLNFGGSAFIGTLRWLQVEVRTNGGGAFSLLSPRQQVTPSPYAIYAATATSATFANTVTGPLLSGSLAGTYASAVNLVNPTNTFAGSFNGNGLGMTNLYDGVVITVGQSNAMFGPFTPGTTTAGLQEAFNYLPKVILTNNLPRGGRIRIGPGIYTNLTLDLDNRYYTSLIIEGAGEIATELSFNNLNRPGIRTTGNYSNPEGARLHLYLRDCALVAEQNTTNAILDLTEFAVLDVEHCHFTWFGYARNTLWGISTAPNLITSNQAPCKVIGAHVWGTDENNTRFYRCHFSGLADGIWASCAHLTVEDCQFTHIGTYYNGELTVFANGWPSNQTPSLGASVLMDGMGYEAQVVRGNFIASRCSVALLNSIVGNYLIQGGYIEGGGHIYSDDSAPLAVESFNGGGWGAALVVNNSGRWTVTQNSSQKTVGGGMDQQQTGTLWGFADASTVSVDPGRYLLRVDDQKNVTVKNTLTVGGAIIGNGSRLSNLPATNLAGKISTGNLPSALTTNVVIGGSTFFITNGLIMRITTTTP
ncbi:MAG: hypothetical protein U1F65_01765 [Verrucomicrobiota bacterium]